MSNVFSEMGPCKPKRWLAGYDKAETHWTPAKCQHDVLNARLKRNPVDISDADMDSLETIFVGVAEGTDEMTLEGWIKDFVQKRPSMALLDVKSYTKKLETETDPAMRAVYAEKLENAKFTAEHCQDLLTQWEALGDMKARLTRTEACVLKLPTDLYVNKPAKLVEWVRTACKTNFVWDITIGSSVEKQVKQGIA